MRETTTNSQREILCVYPWLTLGGADKFNLDMLAQLRARGYRSSIVTTLAHAHPWRPQFEQVCDSIHDVGALPPERQPAELLAIVAAHQPDFLLISNSALAYRLLPAIRAASPETTLLDYNHALDPADPRGGYAGDSLEQREQLDLQVVSSKMLHNWMIARGGDPERLFVCTTNIDTEDWNPARYDRAALRHDLGIAEGAFVGLFAARLDWVKRPPLAARLINNTVRALPDSRFLIAGDGVYAGFLRSYLNGHSLAGKAHMLGPISNQRMRELLALSDVLLLPSRSEGLSLAIYEAMAMGVVPISVAAGGQAELVTPECGVLVPHGPNEEQEYARALKRLASDHSLRQAMGRAARARVQSSFRLDQMGDRIAELLARAAALHSARPHPPTPPSLVTEALHQAAEIAARDVRWRHADDAPQPTLRQQASRLYWSLVERGAWWLVPPMEWLRARNN